jgi:hypothetical protein
MQKDSVRADWRKPRHDIQGESSREPSQNASMKASSEQQHTPDQEEAVCEFYNVLWIERREGIACRRACGWVPKYIWEAHATGPVELKLG